CLKKETRLRRGGLLGGEKTGVRPEGRVTPTRGRGRMFTANTSTKIRRGNDARVGPPLAEQGGNSNVGHPLLSAGLVEGPSATLRISAGAARRQGASTYAAGFSRIAASARSRDESAGLFAAPASFCNDDAKPFNFLRSLLLMCELSAF